MTWVSRDGTTRSGGFHGVNQTSRYSVAISLQGRLDVFPWAGPPGEHRFALRRALLWCLGSLSNDCGIFSLISLDLLMSVRITNLR